MQKNHKIIYGKKRRLAGLLLAALLVLCGCTKKEELLLLDGEAAPLEADRTEEMPSEEESGGEKPDENLTPPEEADFAEKPDVIYVHVCGAVLRSGVYELEAGSRVYEAVQAAGGFAEDADRNYVNQAQELGDGIKLVIPTLEEAAANIQAGITGDTFPAGAEKDGQAADGGRININTASETQLCEIPGVGKTRAAAIIAYREAHGGFQKPEDIMQVDGIGEGMYGKMKDSIRVD